MVFDIDLTPKNHLHNKKNPISVDTENIYKNPDFRVRLKINMVAYQRKHDA